ncbi:serine hydrolase domain-containing protein [Brevundimonas variabilis]|uniref:CubicO group peptidase (Beta-lactamase class C family) n=1 Tax=Brevundimonas variabilis TaxID=74312 RepID=A0A7W9CHR9_9CAUL|nr:serine hydrolase domain-containing protein [Brevundimonas variabilis]MBB5745819.1 CubicO group peptidase (beta-lactamase class C family) [Brevundimonas variabilis]
MGQRVSVVDRAEAAAAVARPPVVVVEALPQLAARLRREGDAGHFMGAVLVAKGDKVLFREAYGLANHETGQPLALDARFRLASISKQFTAAAVLKLQDEGKLHVDDAVCKWIQPCPEAWAPLKLGHLMSHTSGIPDIMAQAQWGLIRVTPRTKQELTNASASYGLSFPPGSKIRYNNAGFNLLTQVVEKASGKPFETYLQDAFFTPLGMTNTGSDADGQAGDLVMGYANFPGGLTAQPDANVSVVVGAGALYSTLDDLLIWNRALHNGRVLSDASYARMITDHSPPDQPDEQGRPHRSWGYGVFVNSLGDRVQPAFSERQIYHTGSWAGFRNIVTHEPVSDTTVVVLGNNYHQREQVFLISQQAMAEALGHPFPQAGLE